MSILNFTVEEINFIAIYKEDTAAATLARIADALPDMDADIRAIAEQSAAKITALTEPEFIALSFAPTDEDEGGAYE
jgi:DNA-directed RNA polymerase subunit F